MRDCRRHMPLRSGCLGNTPCGRPLGHLAQRRSLPGHACITHMENALRDCTPPPLVLCQTMKQTMKLDIPFCAISLKGIPAPLPGHVGLHGLTARIFFYLSSIQLRCPCGRSTQGQKIQVPVSQAKGVSGQRQDSMCHACRLEGLVSAILRMDSIWIVSNDVEERLVKQ